MNNDIQEDNLGMKLEHFVPPLFYSTQIALSVYLLDIIIKMGKNFPIISVSLTGFNLWLAITDFLANNLGFAILNSLFAIGGLIFLIQMRLMDRTTKSKTPVVNKGSKY